MQVGPLPPPVLVGVGVGAIAVAVGVGAVVAVGVGPEVVGVGVGLCGLPLFTRTMALQWAKPTGDGPHEWKKDTDEADEAEVALVAACAVPAPLVAKTSPATSVTASVIALISTRMLERRMRMVPSVELRRLPYNAPWQTAQEYSTPSARHYARAFPGSL